MFSVLHNNTVQAEYRLCVSSNLQQEEMHKIHMNGGLMRSDLVMFYLLKRTFDNTRFFPIKINKSPPKRVTPDTG